MCFLGVTLGHWYWFFCPVAPKLNNSPHSFCVKLVLSYWLSTAWPLSLCLTVKLSIHCWLLLELASSLTDSKISFVLLITANPLLTDLHFSLRSDNALWCAKYCGCSKYTRKMNPCKSIYPWLISLIKFISHTEKEMGETDKLRRDFFFLFETAEIRILPKGTPA